MSQERSAENDAPCKEVFYGHRERGVLSGVDFSISRVCGLPAGHEGEHRPIPPARGES